MRACARSREGVSQRSTSNLSRRVFTQINSSRESIQQAPDAVQNVERVGLTEGYKSKSPLFHKLFLSGVEKRGRQSGHRTIWRSGDRNSKTERFCTSDDPMARSPDDPMIFQPATSSNSFSSISKLECTFCTSSLSSSASIRRIICVACCPSSLMYVSGTILTLEEAGV